MLRLELLSLPILAALCFPSAVASEPSPHHLLFDSGREEYPRYRVPSLVVTSKGTLLAVCEGRADGGGLTGNIDLVLKRSRDSGKTWGPLRVIADDGEHTVGNQSVLADRRSGTIWVAYTRSHGADLEEEIRAGTSRESTRVFLVRSDDDGKTWSPPREITGAVKRPGWAWYGVGPGVGIQLRDGTLVFPAYHSERETRTTRSHVFLSRDGGESWILGGDAGNGNGESQVVERMDGSLYLTARTAKGGPERRTTVESRDQGKTWSKAVRDSRLYDAICQASIMALPDGRWLYCHPAGPGRNDLTICVSEDEGKTWPMEKRKMLREGNSQYSSIALLPDGTVGCFYDCWERGNYRLYFTKFPLEWLE